VIGTTVFLILISIQMRSTNATVAQTARNAALNRAETMATWIEEDLGAMGRNRDDGDPIYQGISREDDEDSPTGSVLTSITYFYENDAGTADSTEIEYGLDESTRVINGEERTLYSLTRRENGTADGGTSATLGYFDIQFIDGNATPTTDENSIRGIRAQFSVVSPFQNEETTLHEVHRMVVVPYTPALDEE